MPKFLDAPNWYDENGVLCSGAGAYHVAGSSLGFSSSGSNSLTISLPSFSMFKIDSGIWLIVGGASSMGTPASLASVYGILDLDKIYWSVTFMVWYYMDSPVFQSAGSNGNLSTLPLSDSIKVTISTPAASTLTSPSVRSSFSLIRI